MNSTTRKTYFLQRFELLDKIFMIFNLKTVIKNMNFKSISRKMKIYIYQQAGSRPKHAPSVQAWKCYAMPPCTAEDNMYIKQITKVS